MRTRIPISVTLVLLYVLGGCSSINILDDGHGLCQSTSQEYPESAFQELERELRKEPPNGFMTQPYSEENWNAYWNSRLFYLYDLGPESCGGTYSGMGGPDVVAAILARRQELELPALTLDDRTREKLKANDDDA